MVRDRVIDFANRETKPPGQHQPNATLRHRSRAGCSQCLGPSGFMRCACVIDTALACTALLIAKSTPTIRIAPVVEPSDCFLACPISVASSGIGKPGNLPALLTINVTHFQFSTGRQDRAIGRDEKCNTAQSEEEKSTNRPTRHRKCSGCKRAPSSTVHFSRRCRHKMLRIL